jgi:hypothetical protein
MVQTRPDTLADAKRVLKSVDLVLQTRQVPLNSGTLVCRRSMHFPMRTMRMSALRIAESAAQCPGWVGLSHSAMTAPGTSATIKLAECESASGPLTDVRPAASHFAV